MKEFVITKTLYDWKVEIYGKTVFVKADYVEPELCINYEPISRSMHVPFDLMTHAGIHAMLEVREQFEAGNHFATPTNNHLLTNEEREIIEKWRYEYALPDYEECQQEIDW